jgi:L-ascorbate metabolism protein UlaG (beta-lactamase superfamily)
VIDQITFTTIIKITSISPVRDVLRLDGGFLNPPENSVNDFKLPPRVRGRYQQNQDDHGKFLQRTMAMWARSSMHRLLHISEYARVVDQWYAPMPPVVRSIPLAITWVGHATFLIQIDGFNILTDPVFGSITPFYPRNVQPGISLDELPPIDVLMISHNHWDHLHGPTMLKLRNRLERWGTTIVAPQGDERWFKRWGFASVNTFVWGQSHTLYTAQRELRVTFLPTEHWSRHGFFDRNKSLWGSWMISSGTHNIYFAGDSAYASHFKQIATQFSTIDVALLPIAPCEPQAWLATSHMNAEQAIVAYQDLNARYMIPMHWGTFNFGCDIPTGPLDRLRAAWKGSADQLLLPKIGQRLQIPLQVPAAADNVQKPVVV